jgi:uncharacterized lipoprotein
MKKISPAAALPVLALSALLLSGCGMFRSHKQWETAKQESPLEIPPGLSTPSTSDALVIPPPGANNPTANGATASVGRGGGVIADGFVLSSSVDDAYRRVGQALEHGDIGQVLAHDDTAHTYTLSVVASAATEKKRGFFGRMFHRDHAGEDADQKNDAGDDAGKGGAHQVQLTVGASGDSASEVRAQGAAPAVAKVIDALKSRLGG